MYKLFMMENFRCFRELSLADLGRVNLIAGVNNVGKTALLEALFIHCGMYNPELVLRLNAFRGMGTVKLPPGRWVETPWESVFSNFDTSKEVVLKGEEEALGSRILRLRTISKPKELEKIGQAIDLRSDKPETVLRSSEVAQVLELKYETNKKRGTFLMILHSKGIRLDPIPFPPPFQTFFYGDRIHVPFFEEAEQFGKLEVQGKRSALLDVLKLIEPRLNNLATVVVAGEPILHGDIGIGRFIPLPVMGGGMVRLTRLVLRIANAPSGVVLVDEIDNGLHHSIMRDVWKAIGEVARQFDTQIFATTHSRECIVAAHRAFAEGDVYDFRLHRLDRVKEAIRVITYDQEALAAAIEAGLEVR